MILTFTGSHLVKGNVVSFDFQPREGFAWRPGQYIHYTLPHRDVDERGDERWFTNSAAPFEGKVTISTRIDNEHGSSFKRALAALKPGDEVEADEPEGDFTIEDDARNYIFVAGGIGITPFRSMLAEAHAKAQELKVTLLYANRNDEIPFRQELEQYAMDNPHLSIDYIIQPETLDTTHIMQAVDKVKNPLVYLSGPEPMVKQLAADLKSLGLDAASVKLDDFPGYEGI
jgi:ferredoxin-NADP reductase